MNDFNNAVQLLEDYPNATAQGFKTLQNMCGDLMAISATGKWVRVTKATISTGNKGVNLEIIESVLIDEGIGEQHGQ